jgi:hypothetical protein
MSNAITEEWFLATWKKIDEIHPSWCDGWFGIEEDIWEEFGVLITDTPEEVYEKVTKGIEYMIQIKDDRFVQEEENEVKN